MRISIGVVQTRIYKNCDWLLNHFRLPENCQFVGPIHRLHNVDSWLSFFGTQTTESDYIVVLHQGRNYSPLLIKKLLRGIANRNKTCVGFRGAVCTADKDVIPVTSKHTTPVSWLCHSHGVIYQSKSFVRLDNIFIEFAFTIPKKDCFMTRWAIFLQHLGIDRMVIRETNVRIAHVAKVGETRYQSEIIPEMAEQGMTHCKKLEREPLLVPYNNNSSCVLKLLVLCTVLPWMVALASFFYSGIVVSNESF